MKISFKLICSLILLVPAASYPLPVFRRFAVIQYMHPGSQKTILFDVFMLKTNVFLVFR